MDYYHCSREELWNEIKRRGWTPCGSQDELSERLMKDDAMRESGATTVATVVKEFTIPRSKAQVAEHGQDIQPSELVGERIAYWTMNTFFPTLQLFFESGLSCTIEGGQLRDASVGMDRNLRYRLTDLTHEEDGVLIKSPLPEKFFSPVPSIRILKSVAADRISISTKVVANIGLNQNASIKHETHMVIGLMLEGMTDIGYVWAKADPCGNNESKTWGDVSVGGLRDDVPFFNFPQEKDEVRSHISVVGKESMISHDRRRREEPWKL